LLEKILGEKGVIVESGRRPRMANREVMMRQLIKKAGLGDLRCMRLILDAHQAPEPVTTVDGNATKEWLEDINIEDLSDKQLADLIKRLRLTVDAMSPKT